MDDSRKQFLLSTQQPVSAGSAQLKRSNILGPKDQFIQWVMGGPVGQFSRGVMSAPGDEVPTRDIKSKDASGYITPKDPYQFGHLIANAPGTGAVDDVVLKAPNAALDMAGSIPFLAGATKGLKAMDKTRKVVEGLDNKALKKADEVLKRTQYKRMGGVKAGEKGPPGYLKEVEVKGQTGPIQEGPLRDPSRLEPQKTTLPDNPADIGKTDVVQPRGQRTYTPSGKSDDLLENQKRNILIDGRDIRTPQDIDQINATLNGYGIKGDPGQQLNLIQSTKEILANRAKNIIASEGGSTNVDDLVNGIRNNLTRTRSQHGIPANEIDFLSDDYVTELYQRAMQENNLPIRGRPTEIPDAIVADMTRLMGDDAASTFRQPDPTKWTKQQTIASQTRGAFDAKLDAKHPNASMLHNDMNDLYRAEGSLSKSYNAQSNEAYKAATAPRKPRDYYGAVVPKNINDTLPLSPMLKLGVNKMLNSPTGRKIAGASAALIGAGAIGYGINELADTVQNPAQNPDDIYGSDESQEKTQHIADSITRTAPNVNIDQSGQYSLPPSPQGLQPLTPGTPDYQQAQAALPGNTRQFMTNAPLYQNSVNRVIQNLKTMPLNILMSFRNVQDLMNYASNPKNPYAQQVADLDGMNKAFISAHQAITGQAPTENQIITPGLSEQQLLQRFATMIQFIDDSYKQYYTPYALTSMTPQGTPAPNSVVNYGESQPQTQGEVTSPQIRSLIEGLPALPGR